MGFNSGFKGLKTDQNVLSLGKKEKAQMKTEFVRQLNGQKDSILLYCTAEAWNNARNSKCF